MIRIPTGRARSLVTALSALLMLVLSVASPADVFRFAWPVPVSVAVKAKMQKKSNESTATYAVPASSIGSSTASDLRDSFGRENQNRPLRRSSIACAISSRVFITNGP